MSSSQQPQTTSDIWEKTKKSSKHWFDKVGVPVNKATQKLGAETFWPTSLDKEADKAARILRSFCIDGFVSKGSEKDSDGKKRLDKIPAEVCTVLKWRRRC